MDPTAGPRGNTPLVVDESSSQAQAEEDLQALNYSTTTLKRERLPSSGQMPTFTLSLESVLLEEPLLGPSRDCNESTNENSKSMMTSSQCCKGSDNRHRKRLGSLFPVKISNQFRDPEFPAYSSLPCLVNGIDSTKAAELFSRQKQDHNGTILSAQASSTDKIDCDNRVFPQSLNSKCSPMEPSTRKDGKYGWIIVLGAFLVSFIIDGICLSFGIFYSEFLDYFGEGQSKTAWTGSVLSGTYSLLGPLASGLSNRYGCRSVCIAGSVISTIAFLLSVLSPNVEILILTYGFIAGLGFSLMYIPAIVMVSFYFEERRALATGITVCGSGIGTFIFAPLTEYLLSIYDWKGAMIVIAGLVLHGAVAGALFRPLHNTRKESSDGESPQKLTSQSSNTLEPPLAKIPAVQIKPAGEQCSFFDQVQSTPLLSENKTKKTAKTLSPLVHNENDFACGWTWKSLDNMLPDNVQASNPRIYATRIDRNYTLYRKDIFYSGSVYNIRGSTYNVKTKGDLSANQLSMKNMKNTQHNGNAFESNTTLQIHKFEDKKSKLFRKILDILSEMTNFSLFIDPLFVIYALSCTLTMFGFMIPFVYLPNCASEAGFSKQEGALLLSVLGIANTAGRVFCGWASDKRWVSPIYINAWALIVTGIVTMVQPEIGSFPLLAFTAFMFGIGVAVFISLRSILMVDLIGLAKLTNGFGLLSMCQGISLILGPPLAGFLRDTTDSYRVPFCLAGTSILIAGILCFPLKYLSSRKKNSVEKPDDRLS